MKAGQALPSALQAMQQRWQLLPCRQVKARHHNLQPFARIRCSLKRDSLCMLDPGQRGRGWCCAGIAVRAGHHNIQPLHEEVLHTPGGLSVRASFYMYNTREVGSGVNSRGCPSQPPVALYRADTGFAAVTWFGASMYCAVWSELIFLPVASLCTHNLHMCLSLKAYSVSCTASAHRSDPC